MKVFMHSGSDEIARVFLAQFGPDHWVEFVESVQPPLPRQKKWVLIVSSLFGCPVRCQMCDAGLTYQGKLSAEQIFAQIDFMVRRRFPDGCVPVEKFKVQFARMGEPALNPSVLEVLANLPNLLAAPGLLPSLSTVAPAGQESFFEELIRIKEWVYSQGRFQLQFSIHSTDPEWRDRIIPVRKWGLADIAAYGLRFRSPGDKKITLNFALIRGVPVQPEVLLNHFDPAHFLIKITPVNPTYQASANRFHSHLHPATAAQDQLVVDLRRHGYEVIPSVGELEENQIGSNCGQSLIRHLGQPERIDQGYSYEIREWSELSEKTEIPVSTSPV